MTFVLGIGWDREYSRWAAYRSISPEGEHDLVGLRLGRLYVYAGWQED